MDDECVYGGDPMQRPPVRVTITFECPGRDAAGEVARAFGVWLATRISRGWQPLEGLAVVSAENLPRVTGVAVEMEPSVV